MARPKKNDAVNVPEPAPIVEASAVNDTGMAEPPDLPNDTPEPRDEQPRAFSQRRHRPEPEARAAEAKVEEIPFLDPEPEPEPEAQKPEPEAQTAEATNEAEPATDDFDEDLYARARAAGLDRSEIEQFSQKPGRLQRMIEKIEARREPAQKPVEKRTEPEKKRPQFNEAAVMEKYGITEKDDPLLEELRAGFNARHELAERLEAMEQRALQRDREQFAVRIDNHFTSKEMLDRFGDVLGGSQSRDELGDSREGAARDAILERAKFDARQDYEKGRRPKSERQYLLEAADSLYGHILHRRVRDDGHEDKANKLRDRQDMLLRRPDGRNAPRLPEMGDEAAKANLRKYGVRADDTVLFQEVSDSLLG